MFLPEWSRTRNAPAAAISSPALQGPLRNIGTDSDAASADPGMPLIETYVASSATVRLIHTLLPAVASSEAPVLIHGETGVGKEVLARQVHALSPRAHKPFLKLNCAALRSEFAETELFGYERGAFGGAFQRAPGIFDLADRGTLLLDEIGDMDFKLQAKLLQVLQDHEFRRLGGNETMRGDVRVIATTHRDLNVAISEGTFRQDLYYRLNVVTLCVPPLRELRQDIVPLTEFLLKKYCREPLPEITPKLQKALLEYGWPGNVRELENMVRKLVILRNSDIIASDLTTRASNMRPRPRAGVSEAVAAAQTSPELEPILQRGKRIKRQMETRRL
jgi:two-component system response regulator AtoC